MYLQLKQSALPDQSFAFLLLVRREFRIIIPIKHYNHKAAGASQRLKKLSENDDLRAELPVTLVDELFEHLQAELVAKLSGKVFVGMFLRGREWQILRSFWSWELAKDLDGLWRKLEWRGKRASARIQTPMRLNQAGMKSRFKSVGNNKTMWAMHNCFWGDWKHCFLPHMENNSSKYNAPHMAPVKTTKYEILGIRKNPDNWCNTLTVQSLQD